MEVYHNFKNSNEMNLWKLYHLTTKQYTIEGLYETRYLSEFMVQPTILNKILNQSYSKISFNLMVITTDHKVLLLQRTQSFHFPKVIKDLKFNKIDFNLLSSLYTSELEKIKKMVPVDRKLWSDARLVRIFPGGHSFKNEPIITTLTRELQEETCLNINRKDLRFNQAFIFNVLIYDTVVKKYFNNFIFPIKVNITSQDIQKNFQETKHVTNPTFIDISTTRNLFKSFIKVQQHMTR